MNQQPPGEGEMAENQTRGAPPRRRFLRCSSVELLVALVLFIVVTPFFEDQRFGDLIEAVLLTAVLVTSVLAIGARRRLLLVTGLLAAPAFVGKWINHFRPDLIPAVMFLPLALVFVAFVIVNLLRFVVRSKTVNAEVLCASISAYLMLGMLWAFAYMFVSRLSPGAFAFNIAQEAKEAMNGSTALYFSFVTLSTVGYGDITPVSHVARMLAMMEAMTGLLYVAVLIARLVSMYSVPSQPDQQLP